MGVRVRDVVKVHAPGKQQPDGKRERLLHVRGVRKSSHICP